MILCRSCVHEVRYACRLQQDRRSSPGGFSPPCTLHVVILDFRSSGNSQVVQISRTAPHAVSCLAPAIEKCLAVVVRHRVRSRRVFSMKRRRTSALSVYWRAHLPTAADGSAVHRNDTDDVDGRRRQFLSFLFSLACSFCALLVMDEDVWSYIRLFLIKVDLSSLCLLIMGKATGGGAGRRGHSSGSSAAGRKVSLAVRRRHQTRYSVVRSFDNVAAIRRAACLKGLGSLTGENEKRRLARRWWPQLFKTKLCSRDSVGRCELRYMPDLTKRVRCPDFRGRR